MIQPDLLDVGSAIALSANCVIEAVLLVTWAKISRKAKIWTWVVFAALIHLSFIVALMDEFNPRVLDKVPTPLLACAISVLIWLLGWSFWPKFKQAVQSIPLAALIGVNSSRIAGVIFLLLWHAGRLSAPFALFAGWGDIITGVFAIPLSIMAATGRRPSKWAIWSWNKFGALELLNAITLGFLSVPNVPWRVFMATPGTDVLGTLPWIILPAILVPIYLMTHFAVWRRMKKTNLKEA
jgi:hypothetical protein